jgi:hypothetical protein
LLDISIIHNNIPVDEITLVEGEEITVRAMLEPYDAHSDIEWVSSDPGVFTVIPFGAPESEARIEAVSSGSAVLIVTSGTVVRWKTIIVIGIDVPESFASPLGQFYANIDNINVGLNLSVLWVDGPQAGRVSEYWRTRDSSTWYITRVTGAVDVINPEFIYDGSTLFIDWPSINYARTHYLYEDGTGYYSRDEGRSTSVDESLIWELTID